MLSIPGVTAQTLLYESANSLVYRAIREADNQPIILKLLKESYPTPQELGRYRTEYRITQELKEAGVVRVYDLQKYQNSLVMFVEDFGGESLKIWMQQRSFTLEEFLQIAIATTEIVGQIHSANIIHKDINPSNIVYNPETGELKIIDFGISTQLSRETPILTNPGILEGTLAYISPEQTGRMNRTLDYRTDFYSLGVTFYELLTGKLPFETEDALELVHCHIARQPLPPHEIKPEVPVIVSQLVSKLMAKNAENRYQTAGGLKHDLEMCLVQLQETDSIEEFELATRDITDRFLIPEKLYGRETSVSNLLAAFERVSTGSAEMMLVAGLSGIGKTAVVKEVHKPIARQQGYFIKGKYDQFQRNIPFSAFVQAFRELMGQLLSESDAQLQTWKTKILTAVGESGQVLIEVIPELERIIGAQPIVLELSGSAAQNRFNLLMQKFVQVFTTAEHPLVMFLDDLQWADSASLKLLQLLMEDRGHLLVLGAYRDNEVSPVHSFMLTVDEIIKSGAVVNTINLQPLSLADMNQLVADTLICNLFLAEPLTELVYQKTKGNPFFSTQFIKALYEDGQIIFDWNVRHWQCDIAQARLIHADDVVEFMAAQLQKLPKETQDVLKLAACIGAQFDLETLAVVSEELPEQTASSLWKALQEGLILLITEGYDLIQIDAQSNAQSVANPTYRFLHDRVQQAAYSLIPEEQKKTTHLKIGRLLSQETDNYALEKKLFDIVNQFNIGREFIAEAWEKEELANLNLKAGRKAQIATAYEAAVRYLTVGVELLPENSWNNHYELTLNLYQELAESEYLNVNFVRSFSLTEIAVHNAATLLEQVNIYQLQMQISNAQLEMLKSVEIGLKVLEKLGISILTFEGEESLMVSLPNLADLESIPPMTDPYKLAAMQILNMLCHPALQAKPEIYPQIIITMVNLCSEFGNSALSALAYGFYGAVLVGFGKLDAGYQSGFLALNLLEKFDAKELRATVYNLFNGNIRTWKEHAKNSVVPLKEGVKNGLETGEIEWASYCACNLCSYLFFTANDLEFTINEQGIYIDLCVKLKQKISTYFSQVWRQLALNFLGLASDRLLLVGDSFDEVEMLPRLIESQSRTVLFVFYVAKTILYYHFQEYAKAIENVALAQEQASAALGFMQVAVINFYHSLALLACDGCPATEGDRKTNPKPQKSYMEQVKANQEILQGWANNAPMNNQHKYELVEAEIARVLGDLLKAQDYYDRAISHAKQNEYIREVALANELAAKFYLEWGKEKIAQLYMIEAYYCYIQWGATAKVKDLERLYPHLLKAIQPGNKNTKTTATVTTTGSGNNLDITTVMKASQAISGEIRLDHLMSSLMKILMESAGAQRGYLILSNQGKLLIEAEGTINSEQVTVLQSISVETCQELSTAIVNYVARTQESVVLDDAVREGQFTNDPYIQKHQPKSILCVPLINQSQIISIVYLENNLTAGAFTPERVELLKVLSGQAAISIQNSKLYTEVRENETRLAQLNKAYERFVPNQFLQFLEKSSIIDVELGDQVQLEMSVLFSDIRDFTTLSETMTPEDNFRFINSYLSRMEPVINENNGFIDKYIGDAIMALFSGEADHAVKAGIAMLQSLVEYNQHRANSGYGPIQIGIGINTGTLMLGTVGGQNRMDGTVISDAVNLASRVESLTKNYGVSLLITQETYSRLENPSQYAIRTLDTVKVKGKSELVTVYEVFDADGPEIKAGKLATLELFAEARANYLEGKLAEAAGLFAECWRQNPGDAVAKIYWERCQSTLRNRTKIQIEGSTALK